MNENTFEQRTEGGILGFLDYSILVISISYLLGGFCSHNLALSTGYTTDTEGVGESIVPSLCIICEQVWNCLRCLVGARSLIISLSKTQAVRSLDRSCFFFFFNFRIAFSGCELE